MIGNVSQLSLDIADALNVQHDGSKRVTISEALATAIAAYLETVTVTGTTVENPTSICPATSTPHIQLEIEGTLI
jgi:hypothetical protein